MTTVSYPRTSLRWYVAAAAFMCRTGYCEEYTPPDRFVAVHAKKNISKNCGPYSLYLAARLMDVRCRLKDVLKLFEHDRRGVSMAEIVIAARRLGLKTIPCEVDVRKIDRIQPPIIAYLPLAKEPRESREGHFLVISYVDEIVVQLLSPPLEPILVRHETLRKIWQGDAVIFERNVKSLRLRLLAVGILLVLMILASMIALGHMRKRSTSRDRRIVTSS